MRIPKCVGAGIASVLWLGLTVVGPAPASATNMASQQAILLIHVSLGGGTFFTSNYVFAETYTALRGLVGAWPAGSPCAIQQAALEYAEAGCEFASFRWPTLLI